MRGLSGEELLGLPVRFNGIELGRPVDVLFDREVSRAVGLEVVCGDDERRFLPLSVTTVDGDSIAIGSPFLLVDESGLSFYREEARTLRACAAHESTTRVSMACSATSCSGRMGRSMRLCSLPATERRECHATACAFRKVGPRQTQPPPRGDRNEEFRTCLCRE
jgi:hypothetical protein